MDERAAALEARIASLEKQNAVLEIRMASMQGDSTQTTTALKELTSEIHKIREMIAAGKGAWWAAAGILGLLVTAGGFVGALMHKVIGGQG